MFANTQINKTIIAQETLLACKGSTVEQYNVLSVLYSVLYPYM